MAGRGEPIRLGPFTGGLNTASDASAVADVELVECTNFELDIDGSLITRPAIDEVLGADTPQGLTIIGQGVFSGGSYLIGSSERSGWEGTYYFQGGAWILIQANLKARCAVQHGGYVWIVPQPGSKATQNGGRWDPVGGFVADANMPEGEGAIFHKSRMFVTPGIGTAIGSNESRLRFTDPITSSTLSWTATNLIDVSPGDGQKLVDIVVVNDNLMLFKNDSTYILAYDVNPGDAILRSINATIGATTRYCVRTYENSVFVFHQASIYEIINYDFNKINFKVPFTVDSTVPSDYERTHDAFLSVLGDRLIITYYNKHYIYNMKTRTWSNWASAAIELHNFGPVWAMPFDLVSSDNPPYYAASNIVYTAAPTEERRTLRLFNKTTSTPEQYYLQGGTSGQEQQVTVTAHLKTKNYDLADSHHFKKLYWWGADVLSAGHVMGTVNPITAVTAISWGEMSLVTWGSRSTFTWSQPSSQSVIVETEVNHTQIPTRVFVKFLRALRFRQVNFEIDIESDASLADGPPRLFSLTAIVGTKQTVPKQVN